jgi:hypothetical protein
MRVLVYCANGLQGHPIVRQLLNSGHQVRALVRDRNRAAPLASAGADVVAADLDSDDLANLERTHADIEFVVLMLPSGSNMSRQQQGRRALEMHSTKTIDHGNHFQRVGPIPAARRGTAAIRSDQGGGGRSSSRDDSVLDCAPDVLLAEPAAPLRSSFNRDARRAAVSRGGATASGVGLRRRHRPSHRPSSPHRVDGCLSCGRRSTGPGRNRAGEILFGRLGSTDSVPEPGSG